MDRIKKIFYTYFTIFAILFVCEGVAGENLQIVKSVKNINYLSQKIAKDYLYLYYNPKKTEIKLQLYKDIKKLEDNFRLVAKSTDNDDNKNILDFLSYSKDQIKETLAKNISIKNATLMLDYSEALSEGTKSILDTYNYDSSIDRDIRVNLAKILKLYIASHISINPIISKEQLKTQIQIVDTKLKKAYKNRDQSWKTIRDLINSDEEYFVPNILFILIKNMENITKA